MEDGFAELMREHRMDFRTAHEFRQRYIVEAISRKGT
jgi:hypothetical protein